VMNNVSYYNGGRGIHVFRSSNVTVANNSVFNNNTDTCLTAGTWAPGDLSQQGRANNIWINNLSESVQSLHSNNCSLTAGNGAQIADTNNAYNNNVLSTPQSPRAVAPLLHPCIYNNDVIYFSCQNNKCTTDPGYTNATAGVAGQSNGQPTGGTWIPGNSNFAITTTSPAVNSTTPQTYLPAQNTDAGACHHALTTCPNPGTSKD